MTEGDSTTDATSVMLRRNQMNGTEPITSHDSQTVMIAAERNDQINIQEIVSRFSNDYQFPDEVTVIQRVDTYHGPELLVHAELDGIDWNYLISAPGRHAHLYLWVGDGPVDGKRRTWEAIAEIKASLAVEQPPYEICPDCGELIQTIQHEREAISGNCSRSMTLKP